MTPAIGHVPPAGFEAARYAQQQVTLTVGVHYIERLPNSGLFTTRLRCGEQRQTRLLAEDDVHGDVGGGDADPVLDEVALDVVRSLDGGGFDVLFAVEEDAAALARHRRW